MASNILGNVLQGIGKGWLRHQDERKKRQSEQERYDIKESRRMKELERAKQAEQERYDRGRTDRKADEQERYDLGQKRKESEVSKALDRYLGKKDSSGRYVGGMYSDRVNKDPNLATKFEAKLRGVEIPPEPTNRAVADLVMSHKWQDAMIAARGNPQDTKFVIDTFNMYNKRHPVARPKNEIMRGDGQPTTLMPTSKIDKNAMKLLEKSIKATKDQISMLDPYDPDFTPSDKKRLDSLKKSLRSQYDKYQSLLNMSMQPTPTGDTSKGGKIQAKTADDARMAFKNMAMPVAKLAKKMQAAIDRKKKSVQAPPPAPTMPNIPDLQLRNNIEPQPTQNMPNPSTLDLAMSEKPQSNAQPINVNRGGDLRTAKAFKAIRDNMLSADLSSYQKRLLDESIPMVQRKLASVPQNQRSRIMRMWQEAILTPDFNAADPLSFLR